MNNYRIVDESAKWCNMPQSTIAGIETHQISPQLGIISVIAEYRTAITVSGCAYLSIIGKQEFGVKCEEENF